MDSNEIFKRKRAYKGIVIRQIQRFVFRMLLLQALIYFGVVLRVAQPGPVQFVIDFATDFSPLNRINYFHCFHENISYIVKAINNQFLVVNYFDLDDSDGTLDTLDFDCHCRSELYVLDLNCDKAESVLKLASNERGFSKCNRWLLLDTKMSADFNLKILLQRLNKSELNMVSDVIYATLNSLETTQKSDNSTIFLYDFWNPGLSQGGYLRYDLIATYHNLQSSSDDSVKYKKGYFVPLVKEMPIVRRQDMQGIDLKCTAVITKEIDEPFENYLVQNYKPNLDTTQRLNYAILRVVKDMFNFNLFVLRSNSWGYLLNDSINFDGMIGMLQRGEVDIGCSPAYFRLERLQAVDYGAQTWTIRPKFLFRHPNVKGFGGRNVFMVPFQTNVWIGITISSVVIVIIFGKIIKVERKVIANKFPAPKLKKGKSSNLISIHIWRKVRGFDCRYLFESAMTFTRIMCQQGVDHELPTSFASRISVTNTFIFAFLIFQFYSASIVGSLLMEQPVTIKTIRDLIESPLQMGMEDIVYNYDFFKHTTNQDALELYEKKMKTTKNGNVTLNYYSIAAGLKKMQKERFAFHVDLDAVYEEIIKTFSERDICDLQTIQLYPMQWMGNVMQKKSPFRKVINYGIQRAFETGVFSRELHTWVTKRLQCSRTIHSENLKVELIPIASIFLIILFAYLLSLIILVIEIIASKNKK